MTIQAGDRLPDATLIRATPDGPDKTTAAEFFKGRTVVLFAVPGAFTPTCSVSHLPGFVENAEALKAKGVDEVACVAVNDAFVLDAWAREGAAHGKVVMLSDGNGEFTRALGLESDASAFGMGKRSKRYAMIVDDGVVRSIDVEQPGEFKVSSADHVMGQL